MKTQLRNVIHGDLTYPCLMFKCPGCEEFGGTGLHMLAVNTDVKTPSWEWDGNFEKPTLSPSILTKINVPVPPPPDYYKINGGLSFEPPCYETKTCHSYLRNGMFEFLGDCNHSLVNQHVPIPDLPPWVITETAAQYGH